MKSHISSKSLNILIHADCFYLYLCLTGSLHNIIFAGSLGKMKLEKEIFSSLIKYMYIFLKYRSKMAIFKNSVTATCDGFFLDHTVFV